MTLDELKHLFRFQTTADDNYTPSGKLEYLLYEGRTRKVLTTEESKLAEVLPTLASFEFEGFKDRTPYFVKPDPNLG